MTKILLVEDDRSAAMAMVRILRGGGHQVEVAPDAVLAVSSARRDPPDLVVLDLGLPGGNGYLVLQRLRGLAATWPPATRRCHRRSTRCCRARR